MKHIFKNDWAEWYAVDSDGNGYEFEFRPDLSDEGYALVKGRVDYQGFVQDIKWQKSLQKRDRKIIKVGEKCVFKAGSGKPSMPFKVMAIDSGLAWVKYEDNSYDTFNFEEHDFDLFDKEREDFTDKVMHIAMIDNEKANLLYDNGCRFLGGDE